MPYLRLPNGQWSQIPDGVSYEQALKLAQEQFPKLYAKPELAEEGLIPSVKSGIEGLKSRVGTAFAPIFGQSDESIRRAYERSEAARSEIAKSPSWEDVVAAKEKYGLFGGTKEDERGGLGQFGRFIRGQVGESLPDMGVTMASARAGAMLGAATPIPGGTVIGGLLGGVAGALPSFVGGNVQRKIEEQEKTGVKAPLEYDPALKAGVVQSALNMFETVFVLGRLGIGKALGDALLKVPAQNAEQLLAKAAEASLLKSGAKGAAKGLTEIPTEIAQTVLERKQAGLDLLGPDALKEYEATGAGAAGMGVAFGTVGGLHGRRAARGQLQELQDARSDEELQKRLMAEEQAKQTQAAAQAQAQQKQQGDFKKAMFQQAMFQQAMGEQRAPYDMGLQGPLEPGAAEQGRLFAATKPTAPASTAQAEDEADAEDRARTLVDRYNALSRAAAMYGDQMQTASSPKAVEQLKAQRQEAIGVMNRAEYAARQTQAIDKRINQLSISNRAGNFTLDEVMMAANQIEQLLQQKDLLARNYQNAQKQVARIDSLIDAAVSPDAYNKVQAKYTETEKQKQALKKEAEQFGVSLTKHKISDITVGNERAAHQRKIKALEKELDDLRTRGEPIPRAKIQALQALKSRAPEFTPDLFGPTLEGERNAAYQGEMQRRAAEQRPAKIQQDIEPDFAEQQAEFDIANRDTEFQGEMQRRDAEQRPAKIQQDIEPDFADQQAELDEANRQTAFGGMNLANEEAALKQRLEGGPRTQIEADEATRRGAAEAPKNAIGLKQILAQHQKRNAQAVAELEKKLEVALKIPSTSNKYIAALKKAIADTKAGLNNASLKALQAEIAAIEARLQQVQKLRKEQQDKYPAMGEESENLAAVLNPKAPTGETVASSAAFDEAKAQSERREKALFDLAQIIDSLRTGEFTGHRTATLVKMAYVHVADITDATIAEADALRAQNQLGPADTVARINAANIIRSQLEKLVEEAPERQRPKSEMAKRILKAGDASFTKAFAEVAKERGTTPEKLHAQIAKNTDIAEEVKKQMASKMSGVQKIVSAAATQDAYKHGMTRSEGNETQALNDWFRRNVTGEAEKTASGRGVAAQTELGGLRRMTETIRDKLAKPKTGEKRTVPGPRNVKLVEVPTAPGEKPLYYPEGELERRRIEQAEKAQAEAERQIDEAQKEQEHRVNQAAEKAARLEAKRSDGSKARTLEEIRAETASTVEKLEAAEAGLRDQYTMSMFYKASALAKKIAEVFRTGKSMSLLDQFKYAQAEYKKAFDAQAKHEAKTAKQRAAEAPVRAIRANTIGAQRFALDRLRNKGVLDWYASEHPELNKATLLLDTNKDVDNVQKVLEEISKNENLRAELEEELRVHAIGEVARNMLGFGRTIKFTDNQGVEHTLGAVRPAGTSTQAWEGSQKAQREALYERLRADPYEVFKLEGGRALVNTRFNYYKQSIDAAIRELPSEKNAAAAEKEAEALKKKTNEAAALATIAQNDLFNAVPAEGRALLKHEIAAYKEAWKYATRKGGGAKDVLRKTAAERVHADATIATFESLNSAEFLRNLKAVKEARDSLEKLQSEIAAHERATARLASGPQYNPYKVEMQMAQARAAAQQARLEEAKRRAVNLSQPHEDLALDAAMMLSEKYGRGVTVVVNQKTGKVETFPLRTVRRTSTQVDVASKDLRKVQEAKDAFANAIASVKANAEKVGVPEAEAFNKDATPKSRDKKKLAAWHAALAKHAEFFERLKSYGGILTDEQFVNAAVKREEVRAALHVVGAKLGMAKNASVIPSTYVDSRKDKVIALQKELADVLAKRYSTKNEKTIAKLDAQIKEIQRKITFEGTPYDPVKLKLIQERVNLLEQYDALTDAMVLPFMEQTETPQFSTITETIEQQATAKTKAVNVDTNTEGKQLAAERNLPQMYAQALHKLEVAKERNMFLDNAAEMMPKLKEDAQRTAASAAELVKQLEVLQNKKDVPADTLKALSDTTRQALLEREEAKKRLSLATTHLNETRRAVANDNTVLALRKKRDDFEQLERIHADPEVLEEQKKAVSDASVKYDVLVNQKAGKAQLAAAKEELNAAHAKLVKDFNAYVEQQKAAAKAGNKKAAEALERTKIKDKNVKDELAQLNKEVKAAETRVRAVSPGQRRAHLKHFEDEVKRLKKSADTYGVSLAGITAESAMDTARATGAAVRSSLAADNRGGSRESLAKNIAFGREKAKYGVSPGVKAGLKLTPEQAKAEAQAIADAEVASGTRQKVTVVGRSVNRLKIGAVPETGDSDVDPDVRIGEEVTGERKRSIRGAGTDFRLGTAADTGIDTTAAAKVHERIAKNLPSHIKLVYVESLADAPQELQDAAAEAGYDHVKGAVLPDGTVVVIGDAHATVADLEKTFAHELIGHYGVDGILDKGGMGDINAELWAKGPEHVAEVATALGSFPDLATALEAARSAKTDEARMVFTSEMIARAAEGRKVSPTFADKVKQFIKSMIAAVRNWFRQHGMSESVKKDTKEIQQLIKQAYAEYGKTQPGAYVNTTGQVQFRAKAAPTPAGMSSYLWGKTNKMVAGQQRFADNVKANLMGLSFEVQFVDHNAALNYMAKAGAKAKLITERDAMQLQYYLSNKDKAANWTRGTAENGPPVVREKTDAKGRYWFLETSEDPQAPTLVKAFRALAKTGWSDEQLGRGATMYLAAKRVLNSNGKITVDALNFGKDAFTEDELKQFVAEIDAQPKVKAALDEFRRIYNAYNKGLIEFLVQTQAISKEQGALYAKDNDYIPFYRKGMGGNVEFVISSEVAPLIVGNINEQPHLQELVGGDRAILDVFTTSLQNTNMLVNKAITNLAARNAAHTMIKLGVVKAMPIGEKKRKEAEAAGTTPKPAYIRPGPSIDGPNVLRFYAYGPEKDGKAEHAEWAVEIQTEGTAFDGIPEELVMRGIEGIKTTYPAALELMGLPAKAIRKAVILNPLYPVRQIIKDSLSGWATSGADFIPIVTPMKNLADAWGGKNKTYQDIERQGLGGGQLLSGSDRESMSVILRNIAGGKGSVTGLLGYLEGKSMMADAGMRMAAYNSFKKQGMNELETWIATNEMMDFNKRGASPSVYFFNALVPFFNAQIQSLNVLAKVMTGRATMQERAKIKEKFIKRGMAMAGMTMLYALAMQDDEAYKNATPEQRYNNWFVRTPFADEPLRIPIPFEFGLMFKAIPEAIVNVSMGKEEFAPVAKALASMAFNSVPSITPQAVKAPFEMMSGVDTFTWNNIESEKEKRLTPEQRYRDNTTELAKMLGSMGIPGVSPVKVDQFIKTIGSQTLLAAVSMGDVLMGDSNKPPSASMKESKLPLIGGLFQPEDAGGIINAVYDKMKDAEQHARTYAKMQAEDPAKADRFLERYITEVSLAKSAPEFRSQMQKLTAEEQNIRMSRDLAPREKRIQLDELRQYKIEVAKSFRDTIREMR